MKDWRNSPWILWGVTLFLTLSLVPAFAGEQPKGALKLYTSWPMQGAMIPEGTAVKRAVDLAIDHVGGMVAGYKIAVVNLDDASPVTGSWDGTVEAENAQKAIADADAMAALGDFIVNVAGRQHGLGATAQVGLVQARLDAALAVGQFLAYDGFHSKSLRATVVGETRYSIKHRKLPRDFEFARIFFRGPSASSLA